MRAVLIATGYRKELEPLVHSRPLPLLKILDKPFIEHILTFLVSQGIKHFDIILSHYPEMIEKQLEEGHRWGVKFCYHITKNSSEPFTSIIPSASTWEKEPILVVRCDTLPDFELKDFTKIFVEAKAPTFLVFGSKIWTGWTLLPLESFLQIPKEANEENLMDIFSKIHTVIAKAHPFLSLRTLIDFEKSNQKLLSHSHNVKYVPTTAKMVEPGVWMSRAASIHPSSRIRSPVFIGENCQIKAFTQLGPHVVVENNCVIDQKTSIENSVVLERSYLGEGLEVKNSIVDRNILINLTHETVVTVYEDFILSELQTPSFRQYLLRSLGRYFAAILLALFSPLFLYVHLTRNLVKAPVIKLPAPCEKPFWHTFNLLSYQKKGKIKKHPKGFLTCLPMLFNVLKGDLHFTGVPPRTIEEVETLPDDWKRVYLKSKVGLITLAMVEQGPKPTRDELFASEVFYSFQTGLLYDIKLCLKYLFSFRWLKRSH